MLKKDDIILIKSYGNEKTKIFLRGVNEVLMIDASFEEVKFAINNDLQDLQDLQGMPAVSAPLKIVTWFLVRALNIYHNIRCPHRLRGPQGVSEASGLKHTPFCDHIEKNAPDDSGATAWLCTDIPGRDFSR